MAVASVLGTDRCRAVGEVVVEIAVIDFDLRTSTAADVAFEDGAAAGTELEKVAAGIEFAETAAVSDSSERVDRPVAPDRSLASCTVAAMRPARDTSAAEG